MENGTQRLIRRSTVAFAVRVLFVMSALVIGFAPQARANVTYTYTGNLFNGFRGSYACPSVCRVTGSFTVAAALPVNLFTSFRPISFSFTDGVTIFSTSNSVVSLFAVATDGQGRIIEWNLFFTIPVAGEPGSSWPGLGLRGGPLGGTDFSAVGNSTAFVFSPGTWSGVLTPTVTWANPAEIVSGTALSGAQLNATANVPGTFAYTPNAGAVLSPGRGHTLSVLFTPTDTANYITTTKTVTIDVVAVAEIAVFRQSTGEWFIHRAADGGLTYGSWGARASAGLGDIPVPGDYDGDGKTDFAIYRASTGEWFIHRSSDGGLTYASWGARTSAGLGDIPVPGDYDGDGKADFAIYRASTGEWFIHRSSDGGLTYASWGARTSAGLGDIPVPGDYDGDGKADFAIYRGSTGEWFIHRSSDGGLTHVSWVAPALGDVPVQGDYDGDGHTDVAVYRGSTGEWFIHRSSDGGFTLARWGAPASSGLGDVPVPGDYDGDFRADLAIYRGSTGEWFIHRSSDGGLTHASWGAPALGDLPVVAKY